MPSQGCVKFGRSCNGGGHDECRGDLHVFWVVADSAGDGLLKGCVRFQVDQEEADVCLKLLSKDCNGALVLGQVGFEVGDEVVVVLKLRW
jgi:hypothetical protein